MWLDITPSCHRRAPLDFRTYQDPSSPHRPEHPNSSPQQCTELRLSVPSVLWPLAVNSPPPSASWQLETPAQVLLVLVVFEPGESLLHQHHSTTRHNCSGVSLKCWAYYCHRDAWTKRETASEERYIREEEKLKLKELREKLKTQRKHLDDLENHM